MYLLATATKSGGFSDTEKSGIFHIKYSVISRPLLLVSFLQSKPGILAVRGRSQSNLLFDYSATSCMYVSFKVSEWSNICVCGLLYISSTVYGDIVSALRVV